MTLDAQNTPDGSLAEAFTREHHEIDAAIDLYLNSAQQPEQQRAQILQQAVQALRRHIYLEEEIVFPHLPQGTLMMALMVMRREHGELWRRMDALEDALRAGGSSNGLEQDCQELLSLLDQHNSKEEPIIYPQMDTALNAEEQQRVSHLLAGGALPEGWVCQDA